MGTCRNALTSLLLMFRRHGNNTVHCEVSNPVMLRSTFCTHHGSKWAILLGISVTLKKKAERPIKWLLKKKNIYLNSIYVYHLWLKLCSLYLGFSSHWRDLYTILWVTFQRKIEVNISFSSLLYDAILSINMIWSLDNIKTHGEWLPIFSFSFAIAAVALSSASFSKQAANN